MRTLITTPLTRRFAARVILFSLLAALAGCTSSAGHGSAADSSCATSSLPSAAYGGADYGSWPTYQGDPARSADACSLITPSNVPTTVSAWFFPTAGDVTATPAVVNGTVYVGDATGAFYAINQSNGAQDWKFNATAPQSCFVDAPDPHATKRVGAFGEVTSSASVVTVAGTPTVYVGAGGSVFALNATTGRCLWAQDTDPADPDSAVEVESSPVVDTAVTPPEVLIGNDDNGVPGIAVTGLMAFNAQTGALLWKYEPERDLTLTPSEFGGSDALTLSCGDGARDTTYCSSAGIRDLPPNTTEYADACGDVWSSPALDTSFKDPAGNNTFEGSGGTPPAGWYAKQITANGRADRDGLVVFGTANCAANPIPATARAHGDYVDNQTVFALDPVTGVRVWSFVEPYNIYDNNPKEPQGGDDDFGSSPVLARIGSAGIPSNKCAGSGGKTSLVIEGSKDGYAYGLCEATGATVWSRQVGQPGELNQAVGSFGGYVASPSLGLARGKPTVFFDAAIPLPFSNDGILGSGDTNISSCPGAILHDLPRLPVCPDLSLAAHPSRLLPLTAVNAATGQVDWKAASVPTYAATSYTNGVVFAPQTLAFAILAYSANSGAPLWAFPIGAAPSSAAAIVGHNIYFGAGTSFAAANGKQIPPQATGVWAFTDLLAQI